jgi:hypothetical protein
MSHLKVQQVQQSNNDGGLDAFSKVQQKPFVAISKSVFSPITTGIVAHVALLNRLEWVQ